MSRRPSRRAWVDRRPPDDPTAQIDFLLTRLTRVGIFAFRDLVRLHCALGQVTPTPEQSRRWRATARQVSQIHRTFLTMFNRDERRRIRRAAKQGDEAWLREQLAGLGEAN